MSNTGVVDTSAEAGPSQPSSTFARWSDAFSRMTGARSSSELSPEQQEDRIRIQEEKDYTKCEKWKMDLMRKSESRCWLHLLRLRAALRDLSS